jgi:hypothetical protein
MCSACLRRTKRETRPEFYLGTCYSEISRRCNHFDKQRPNYFGKKKLSKEQFITKFKNDITFLKLYKNWQKNSFKRKFSPSIDRINNKKDYSLDNLRFISHAENTCKDRRKVLLVENTEFQSQKEAANFLNISPAYLCRALQKSDSIFIKGKRVCRI